MLTDRVNTLSESITIASQLPNTGWGDFLIAFTVPDIDECTGDDINFTPSAIREPVFTLSPGFTTGLDGVPICCIKGMTT